MHGWKGFVRKITDAVRRIVYLLTVFTMDQQLKLVRRFLRVLLSYFHFSIFFYAQTKLVRRMHAVLE